MAKRIWSQGGNPTKYVSDSLGIERWQLKTAIHKIKQRSGLGPTDDIVIWDNGDVDDSDGERCGNIHDEI